MCQVTTNGRITYFSQGFTLSSTLITKILAKSTYCSIHSFCMFVSWGMVKLLRVIQEGF